MKLKKILLGFKTLFKNVIASDRILIGMFLLVYIFIAHIYLPVFKVGRHSSFFFARWNMFAFPPYRRVVDITWDEGCSFLLRDYRKKALYSGVFLWSVFRRFYMVKTDKLPKWTQKQIMNFCKCQSFDVVLLEGSLSDHIIYKKNLKTLKKKHYKAQ